MATYSKMQITKHGDKFYILKEFSADQLSKIRTFLRTDISKHDDSVFRAFVFFNNQKADYYSINDDGSSGPQVDEDYMFDLWYLLFLILPEVCGFNRNWILFDRDTELSSSPMLPDNIIICKETFERMSSQLIELTREIEPKITIFSNGTMLLTNGPRILDSSAFNKAITSIDI